MNFKIIFFVAMFALLGLSAFVSAEEDKKVTVASEPKRQSVVKSCDAKTRDDCKKCCGKDGLQSQLRGRCVCSRFFN